MNSASEPLPTRALLAEFDRWHRLVTGVPAVIHGGKDAKLIAGICKSHGEACVRELMTDFFETKDPWILQAGYSVGVFVSQAPKLIAARARRAKTQPSNGRSEDWWDECKRLHARTCNGRYGHMLQMEIDAERAKKGTT